MNCTLRIPEAHTLDESAQYLPLWAALPPEGRTRALRLLRALLNASHLHHKELEDMGIFVPNAHQPQKKPRGMAKDYKAYHRAAIAMGASAEKLLATPYVQGRAPTVHLHEVLACFETALAKGFLCNNLYPKGRDWLKKNLDALPQACTRLKIKMSWIETRACNSETQNPNHLAHLWCTKEMRPWTLQMYEMALEALNMAPEEAWKNLKWFIPTQASCPRLDEALKPKAERRQT